MRRLERRVRVAGVGVTLVLGACSVLAPLDPLEDGAAGAMTTSNSPATQASPGEGSVQRERDAGCEPVDRPAALDGCGDCSPGLAPDAEDRCRPVLVGLAVSPVALRPLLSTEVSEYAVALPLLTAVIEITPSAPAATVAIDGSPVESGMPWRSGVLAIGSNRIEIAVRDRTGALVRDVRHAHGGWRTLDYIIQGADGGKEARDSLGQ